MEIRNYFEPTSAEHLSEMVKTAAYFDQLFQDEQLMHKLIAEGEKAIVE